MSGDVVQTNIRNDRKYQVGLAYKRTRERIKRKGQDETQEQDQRISGVTGRNDSNSFLTATLLSKHG